MKRIKLLFKISLILNILTIAYVVYKLIFSFYIPYRNTVSPAEYADVPGYWLNRSAYLNSLEIDSNSILFVGDSHFQLFHVGEHFSNPNFLNRGIIGDNTNGVFHRISDYCEAKPAKIVLLIGINDLLDRYRTEEALKKYKQILDTIQVKSPKTKIFVLSILPSDKLIYQTEQKVYPKIRAFNKELKQICEVRNLFYLDFFNEFSKNGKLNPSLQLGDGIHLNGKGYQLLTELLKNNL